VHDPGLTYSGIEEGAPDIPLYGGQEGRFFHGYYDEYRYLPLYVICGRHPLLARQRRANVAGSDGAIEEMTRIVAQIRQKWPRVAPTRRGPTPKDLRHSCSTSCEDLVLGSSWPRCRLTVCSGCALSSKRPAPLHGARA
jgi:hypothetical protein